MEITKETIRKAQAMLILLDYALVNADGELNHETGSAIRAFQKRQHLHVTGELDRDTLAALNEGAVTLPEPFDLSTGDEPFEVIEDLSPLYSWSIDGRDEM